MDYLPPTKPPTSAEYSVIAMGAAVLLVMMGLVGLGFAFFSSSNDMEAKHALVRLSCVSLGCGALTGGAWWLARRWMV